MDTNTRYDWQRRIEAITPEPVIALPRLLLAFVFVTTLGGCSSTHWVAPSGKSTQQIKKDTFECTMAAEGATAYGTASNNIYIQAGSVSRYNTLYTACLDSRGYVQEKD